MRSSGARSGTATSRPGSISACIVRAGNMVTPRPSLAVLALYYGRQADFSFLIRARLLKRRSG
jgi:hypothetical protein